MKMRKWLLVILSIVLTISMSFPANAGVLTSNKVMATIDSRVQTFIENADADKRIPVDIWLYETTSFETREQNISAKIGLNKAQIILDTKGTVSSQKIDEYIATERAMYANERAQQYAAIRQDYAKVEGLQETRQADTRLFYSQYAPMISAELTSSEIKLLAGDSRVESICYSPDVTLEFESDISVPLIEADYVRDNLGYSGSGMKIGMIEPAVPDKNIIGLTNANIEYDDTLSGQITHPHSNTVATIMVAQATTIGGVTYEGIVPDATLYATYYESGNATDWRARVEWLLSQNVHVINMSAGLSELPAGVYSSQERWVDHVGITHSVHFVKSAGNKNQNNNGKITSPGMAYNVITVGAINDKNTAYNSDDLAYIDTNFIEENETLTNKPDLVAPGTAIYTTAYHPDYYSGTSLSAPHVTAVVAQMCQRRPALKVQQDVMKAILTAAISHSNICYTPADSNNYDKFGAGVVNADEAYYVNNNYRFTMSNFAANSADGSQKTYTFSVSSADTRVRVSLSWLKYAVLSGTHSSNNPTDYPIANLDLYVYDPSGVLVGSSTTQYNNTEIVDFEVNTTGTYKIVVKQTTHSERAVYFGLAWW